jgi:hypothetical protein
LPQQNRRRSERFGVEIPVTVQWMNGTEQRRAQSVTQDVSSGGVFFFLPCAIPDGTAIELEMTLPSQITLGAPVTVRCQGHIQRSVLNPGDPAGMAAILEKYEFLFDSKDAA